MLIGVVSLATFLITDMILVPHFLKMRSTRDALCSILVALGNWNVRDFSMALVRAKSNVILTFVISTEWIPGPSVKYARNLLIILGVRDLELQRKSFYAFPCKYYIIVILDAMICLKTIPKCVDIKNDVTQN